MNSYTVEAKYGDIIVTSNAISKVILKAIKELRSSAIITTSSGKTLSFLSRIGGFDELSLIDVSFQDNSVHIAFNVTISGKESPSNIVDKLITKIDSRVNKLIEVIPESISINIVGSKKKLKA